MRDYSWLTLIRFPTRTHCSLTHGFGVFGIRLSFRISCIFGWRRRSLDHRVHVATRLKSIVTFRPWRRVACFVVGDVTWQDVIICRTSICRQSSRTDDQERAGCLFAQRQVWAWQVRPCWFPCLIFCSQTLRKENTPCYAFWCSADILSRSY